VPIKQVECSEMPFSAQAPWFVRAENRGMIPHNGGMLGGSGMGRTDTLPISVPSGSYVIPSDLVAGIGDGNSNAGGKILASFFRTGPLGMSAPHIHGGFGGPHNIRMGVAKLPRGSSTGSIITATKQPGFADGGYAHGGVHAAPPGHTPIVAASGEFVIPAEWILQRYGDLKRGHDVLDKVMMDLRKKHVKEIRQLPPPVKR
jgi:hypothetical protein